MKKLFERFQQLAQKNHLAIVSLGTVDSFPLLLLTPTKLASSTNVLIAAGFHGDEPAGYLGILRLLEKGILKIQKHANISFLPMVNPTGICHGTRENKWNQDPNRGFSIVDRIELKLSVEGEMLFQNLNVLKILAKDGFLSLHEDIESDKAYVYTFEQSALPSELSYTLRNKLETYFELVPNGKIEDAVIKLGVIFRHNDTSFEEFLFHTGIPYTACTETPGMMVLKKRITANVGLINKFVEIAIGTNIKNKPSQHVTIVF